MVKNSRFMKASHDTTITVGAAISEAVVQQDNLVTLDQDVYVSTLHVLIAIEDLTATEGPIEIGVAQSELTTTEIAEALDASPTSEYDIPASEHAKRFVRSVGFFDGLNTHEKMNEGRPLKIRINRRFPAGQELPKIWLRNKSGATLTTGATVVLQQTYFGNWR